MKNIAVFIMTISCSFLYSQNQQDTILMNDWDIADTIYGGLDSKSQTGILFNRLEMDSADAVTLNTDLISNNLNYKTNADLFYRLIYELKVMSIDTSEVIGLKQLYDTTSQYIGMHDFISERIIIPIGIADYEFEEIDIDKGVSENKIISTSTGYFDNSIGDYSLNKTYVREMYAVDNSAGSYLNSVGNMISLTSWTYFTLQNLVDGRNYFTHKPVVTALAINPNLWQNNGSMSVDLKSLGLMGNTEPFDFAFQSNFYGYPNLGNPTNYLDITPFEAIYCDEIIDPHIKLKDAPPAQATATTNFILNETEPWYLGLQNRVFGSKMRSNYNYFSRRRARNIIYFGKEVTPTTGKGDYTVLSNITLLAQAGDEIIVADGTHFTPGSDVTLQAGYFYVCDNPKSAMMNKGREDKSEYINSEFHEVEEPDKKKVLLYPNPSNYSFTLASKALIPIVEMVIFNMSGQQVSSESVDKRLKHNVVHELSKGIYFVHVTLIDGSKEKIKIIVP